MKYHEMIVPILWGAVFLLSSNQVSADVVLEGKEQFEAPLSVSVTDQNKININTASAEEIATKLKGIGIKKAQSIVEYREEYGKFDSLEQLQEVSGIGHILLERNLSLIQL